MKVLDVMDGIHDCLEEMDPAEISSAEIFVKRPLDGSLTPVHQIYRAGTNIIIEMNIHYGKAVQ